MTQRSALAARAERRLERSWRACFEIIALTLALVASTSPSRAAPAEPRGWVNPHAFQLAKEAIEAKKENNIQLCVAKDQASLALEEHPYVELHLASCLQASGKLVDALNRAKTALAAGLRNGDEELSRTAGARVSDLLPRIAHVKLFLPTDPSSVKVTFDGIPVRPALFKHRVAVDPGDHVIDAEGTQKGEATTFNERFTLAEGEERAIEILLKPGNVTKAVIDCIQAATTYEERLACVERKSNRPSVRLRADASGYVDSTSVNVFSPSISGSVASPTAGWSIAGSYLVDVVSAASPDIVSMASRSYKETRHAVALGGGAKLGPVALGLSGNVSSEPDYLSRTVGGSISADLADKLITPRLAYNLSGDRIGIRNTPFDTFERNLTTHQMEAGVTFILSATTLLTVGTTAQLERGEEAKLYRYIPMFSPADAALVRPGQPIASVNESRLAVRAREQLPRERDRFSVGGRINHRLTSGSLRLEERLYADSWGMKATTTDARYVHDLGDHLRAGPHLRFHGQNGASFYRLAYAATIDQDGVPLQLLTYRTADRELSPMIGITAGGSVRIALTSDKALSQYAIVLSGDVMYNRYFEALYIFSRSAMYGTVGFEAEL